MTDSSDHSGLIISAPDPFKKWDQLVLRANLRDIVLRT